MNAAGPSPLPVAAALLDAARRLPVATVGAVRVPDEALAALRDGSVGAILPVRDATARRAEVVSTDAGVIAVASGAIRDLVVDPYLDRPSDVVRAVVDHVRARGLRVTALPEWVDAHGHGAGGLAAPVSDVLVVTDFLDSEWARLDDHLVQDLVRGMVDCAPDVGIHVLLTDGFRSEACIEALQANGVEVVTLPVDIDGWLQDRVAMFGHVIVTPAGLRSVSWERLARTQPQAARVLYLPSLPFRDVSALAPQLPDDELSSLELVRGAEESWLIDAGRSADAVWCDTEADARWAEGTLLGIPVVRLGGVIEPEGDPRDERGGVLLFGDAGHDVVAANEDAVAFALEHIVIPLRARLPQLPVRVVVDRPSPFLEERLVAVGVDTVPSELALEAASSARVVLDYRTYGTGGESAVRLALATATPFVAHPASAERLELDRLRSRCVFSTPADVTYRVHALLTDDERWEQVSAAIRELAARRHARGARDAALREALARLGLGPVGRRYRWVEPAPGKPDALRYRPVPVPLRPQPAGPPLSGSLEPADPDARYQQWARRYGPTPEVLAGVRAALDGLRHRPTFSIVVPVFDTPEGLLAEMVASVRGQLYERWELVLADDGSTRPETLDALAALQDDPKVRVVRAGGNGGIAAATNVALGAATGDYVAFLDHDDVLKPHALAQVARWIDADPTLDLVYSDEDKLDQDGNLVQVHLKPDWSPNLLLTQNYVCHFTVARRSLVAEVGGLRSEYDGSQDHDLVLRLCERTDRIAHIPEPLYSWRITAGSAALDASAKPYAAEAGRRAVQAALDRRGQPAEALHGPLPGLYRPRFAVLGRPRVAVIVPTRNGRHLLEPCLRSVVERSTYRNYEIVVVDNGSDDGATLEYLARFPGRVLRYPHPFNYARIINYAAKAVTCDAYLFLNNDTEVITPEWMELLLEHAMRRDVGAVGPRLRWPDGRIQHEGIVVGFGGNAAYTPYEYFARGSVLRDVSAVTGACTMMRSSAYWRLGGYDEQLRVAYNDVDLCLRSWQAGLAVVYTPEVDLYHHESASRGKHEHVEDGPGFGRRWLPEQRTDPRYHPLFSRAWPPFRVEL